ncbi:hypothetical protein EJ04DRAFT_598492 [Polyplosphaeria fusca]|uniref:Uncharacterized protein n=1 Tax=Polyplosphaeria fusca TaxID=682080 RepID=A0A9P4R3B0_9PLEO|nr:hypothetical protein EJ04DRAFT_598492 [Polyplosphaeria fusca]
MSSPPKKLVPSLLNLNRRRIGSASSNPGSNYSQNELSGSWRRERNERAQPPTHTDEELLDAYLKHFELEQKVAELNLDNTILQSYGKAGVVDELRQEAVKWKKKAREAEETLNQLVQTNLELTKYHESFGRSLKALKEEIAEKDANLKATQTSLNVARSSNDNLQARLHRYRELESNGKFQIQTILEQAALINDESAAKETQIQKLTEECSYHKGQAEEVYELTAKLKKRVFELEEIIHENDQKDRTEKLQRAVYDSKAIAENQAARIQELELLVEKNEANELEISAYSSENETLKAQVAALVSKLAEHATNGNSDQSAKTLALEDEVDIGGKLLLSDENPTEEMNERDLEILISTAKDEQIRALIEGNELANMKFDEAYTNLKSAEAENKRLSAQLLRCPNLIHKAGQHVTTRSMSTQTEALSETTFIASTASIQTSETPKREFIRTILDTNDVSHLTIAIAIASNDTKNMSRIARLKAAINPSANFSISGEPNIVRELRKRMDDSAREAAFSASEITRLHKEVGKRDKDLASRVNEMASRSPCTISSHKQLEDEVRALKAREPCTVPAHKNLESELRAASPSVQSVQSVQTTRTENSVFSYQMCEDPSHTQLQAQVEGMKREKRRLQDEMQSLEARHEIQEAVLKILREQMEEMERKSA